MRSYILLLCESVHLVCNFGVRIQDQLPTLAPKLRGGLPPFGNSGLREILFRGQAGMAGLWIGWIEVGCLSVRIAGVSLGIGRGKIVDCGGCLSVG